MVSVVVFVGLCSMAIAGGSEETGGGGTVEKENRPLKPPPIDLEEVEVREYQGKDLSPLVGSFRENSIKGVQYVDIESYRLTIDGRVESPLEMTYPDVLDLDIYQKVVTLNCVEGWSSTILWEGVLVRDLLDAAGADRNSAVVIFHAEDGYTTSHTLEYFYDNDIIMAYRMNGVTMPYDRGYPFQLVAEDKWGYKWIRWIVRMEVSNDREYRGFWEQRGYSNEGDLDRPSYN